MRFDLRSLAGSAAGGSAPTCGGGPGAGGGSPVTGCVTQPVTHKKIQRQELLVTQADSQDVYLCLTQAAA